MPTPAVHQIEQRCGAPAWKRYQWPGDQKQYHICQKHILRFTMVVDLIGMKINMFQPDPNATCDQIVLTDRSHLTFGSQ